MKRFLYILALTLIPVFASGQNSITVKGVVKDSSGEPVIGAAIMLDGNSSTGAVTDINGNYSLTFTPQKGKKPRFVV